MAPALGVPLVMRYTSLAAGRAVSCHGVPRVFGPIFVCAHVPILPTFDVDYAARVLQRGGLAAFPTETVYGLGANALDPAAVARVFEAKNRPRFDPLIVHFVDRAWVSRLARDFPPVAQQLADRFWPGPLTLVVTKTSLVPDLVTAGGATVALRVPDHPLAQALLSQANLPVAAPSANPFGRVSPTTAEHVREQLGDRIDCLLDGGPCRVGVESTVLLVTGDRPRLLRAGGLPLEDIESVIGPVEIAARLDSPAGALAAPGLLPQHYAPATPLAVVGCDAPLDMAWAALPGGRAPSARTPRWGLLCLAPQPGIERFTRVEALSLTDDLREAAAGFFAALRRLDAAGLDGIVARLFPERGLGRALNDRLRRAAHRDVLQERPAPAERS